VYPFTLHIFFIRHRRGRNKWIKELEGRIIAIGVYDKQSYRLVGEGKERAKVAIKEGVKDIFYNHYDSIWVSEKDLFPI
jgi:hypothetical protein